MFAGMRSLPRVALCLLLCVLHPSAFVAAAQPAEPAPLAIQGYDTVAYFTEGRAKHGDPRFGITWDEHRWLFASAAHRDAFKGDPVRYAPQFANFCAVALARGEVRIANPEYWLISDGKLYLFGKAVGPEVFRKSLPGAIERANQNRKLLPSQRSGE
jgi:hypothetical protein